MQPIIGITTYGKSEHPAPSSHYENHYTAPIEYVDAIRRAGGVPVLLPPGDTNWDRWVDKLDGFVVSGGTDVSPVRYGQDAENPSVEPPCTERDETEIALALRLVESTTPCLFVCRGMQVLNVAMGGTLHAHLPDVIDDDIHRAKDGWWTRHSVHAVGGSRLAKAMGTEQAETVSGHHQAVDRVADRLTVTATAPDGIVEALEVGDHPWLVAVQWHPEVSADSDDTQQGIFNELVRACM